MAAGKLLVVGYLSIDTVTDRAGRSRRMPGGACLYAGLGARHAGAEVALAASVGADYPGVTITATPPSALPNAPVTFDVQSGGLPPGLAMDADGLISGTLIQAGTYDFTVVAKSSERDAIADTQDYTIVVTE